MTRMLVEPRRTRDGLPTGCTGATMEDGTVYRADRGGRMEVDNPAHVEAMLRNPAAPGHVALAKFHGAGIPGATCVACGFGAFRWQLGAPCPRCGGELSDDREETT